MAEASIPVDLLNPGQVFACLGFMEAAEILCGSCEAGFDWRNDRNVQFSLSAEGERSPFEVVLEFLAEAQPQQCAPTGYVDLSSEKADSGEDAEEDADADDGKGEENERLLDVSTTFPSKGGDRMMLPIRFGGGNRPVVTLDHWADGSSRNCFKLYSGNRSAYAIARAMLMGVRDKPTKKQQVARLPGDLKSKGIRQLWDESRIELIKAPFDVLTPMGGSFNFDPRGAWTAIDAGYSPNEHKHAIEASPVVEFLAAWGLQNARPDEFSLRQVRYAVWRAMLPPILARAALTSVIPGIQSRKFLFDLDLSGKNKVVTFSREEVRT